MPRPRLDGTPAKAPNKRNLSDAFLRSVKPDPQRVTMWWDSKQHGLVFALQPSGHRAWKVVYSRGRPRWYHIGDAQAIGLADARKLANCVMFEVAEGKDPVAERIAGRGKGTFEELAARYLNEHAKKKNRSWKQADALVRKYLLPRWGKLASVTRRDVEVMFESIEAPILANQVIAAASAIFSWAVKKEIIAINPCVGVDRHETRSRKRVLSDSEITQFWAAFGNAGVVGVALKINLLVGQRPGEVTHMRREHIADGWWNLPGLPIPELDWPGTKNDQNHRVWLTEPVQTLLSGMDGDGFVFPYSRSLDDKMRTTMRGICEQLGVERATPHDLRRTNGTMITRLGFGRDAMNRIQNHIEGGIADVYDMYEYADENRKIMETVARHIIALAEGGDGGNVVELPRTAAR
jgi:integrase